MATGYGGTYRAKVVDNADPLMQNRLLVVVAEVMGDSSVWAMPSITSSGAQVPAVGDDVHVVYEHGDSDYPVWRTAAANDTSPSAMSGYAGVYRATVVDNVDPMDSNRLLVSVPEVTGAGSVWAARSPALLDGADVPEVGVQVWVEFEAGDARYPLWVGVAQ